ncbi:MAG: type II secretion system secretin GspD [Gammaproteobacteria bacterium]|nr:type II secretion system secretin GspD [Gammaproteobacteria bacterium]MDH4253170.1 type II secretion system secretin GspD [Gammaproteobacteria bacterium]MDH5308468.1 type II secretion system secretin GspD [Gammaproteobacteria bacterium]
MITKANRVFAICVAVVLLSSCATAPRPAAVADSLPTESLPATETERPSEAPGVAAPAQVPERPAEKIVLGSGDFVQAARGPEPQIHASGDGVTLNFEKADLREFLRVIFDTILRENYLVDPAVNGQVTLHTTRPVVRDAVIPTVEAVLELNGAALLFDDGMYKVMPLAAAERSARAPSIGRFSSNRGGGFGIQVVPLEHASAAELQKILTPLVSDGSSMRVDTARNLLIVAGPRFRVEELLATVRTFDVDWLKGMSFALFRLEYADAATMVEELQQVVGGEGETPLSGIVRLMPIARLNAVLVIAHRPDHIARVRELINEFDWGVEGSAGRRLFVYELQNGKAENIAASLQEIYGQGAAGGAYPGLFDSQTDTSGVFRGPAAYSRPLQSPGSLAAGPADMIVDGAVAAVPEEGLSNVKIIADDDNNSILVLASQEDYRSIEAAIRRLDVPARQVLIEATIAEVSLNSTLDYGVRWFIEKSDYELGFNAPVPGGASGDGLAFAFFDQDSDVTAFFDLLETASDVRFLSTPQVMALDNQTATIRVGDQIPVTTRSSQSTANPDAPIVTEVQFRDTGTLLTVTPRINAGGQVTLEISQEVSLPGTEPAVGGGGNVSIAQRTITSTVIVQSGQTVVLGGLILETNREGRSGVPILMDIPLLGKAFSTTSQDVFRTELLITVKPVVVESEDAMRRVTEELRERMQEANAFEQTIKSRQGGF